MTRELTCMVVDDELPARQRLLDLLGEEEQCRVVAECGDGESAIRRFAEVRPDLLFLDIQMPGPDGFAVLERIGAEAAPVVIFVTAHDQFAVRAFEVHALDYLLKPFDRKRFRSALERAREEVERRQDGTYTRRLEHLRRHTADPDASPERIAVRSRGQVTFLRPDELDHVSAARNYLRLHVGDEVHLMRTSMKEMEQVLSGAGFLRIHRSTLVNPRRVRELLNHEGGGTVVVLSGGQRLRVGRAYRDRLAALLPDRPPSGEG